MRFGRYNIVVENMNIVESYIQHRIPVLRYDIEILVKEVIEMVLLRLAVIRVDIQVQRILTGITFGIQLIAHGKRIAAQQRLLLWQINDMQHVAFVCDS